MSETTKRLLRLKAITSLLAEKALTPVGQAAARMRNVEDRIDTIAQHRTSLMQASNDPSIAGNMLAQAERLRRAQAKALQELASARVAFETEKSRAAKAVGRDLAIDKLIEKQEAAEKRESALRKLR